MFPNLELPPKPVITRWGTWIEAAMYYADHFANIKSFLSELDPKDAKSIGKAQDAIAIPNLKNELAFIRSNFACIVSGIKNLQGTGMPISNSLEIFEKVGVDLMKMRGETQYGQKY